MEKEKIEYLSKYAWSCYKELQAKYKYCDYDSYEDLRQTLFLLSLRYPEEKPSFLISRVKFGCRKEFDEGNYRTQAMIPFSVFDDRNFDEFGCSFLERFFGFAEDKYSYEEDVDVIEELAELLNSNIKAKEDFLDCVYGSTILRNSFNVRVKIFRKRFKILDFLKDKKRLSERDYDNYVLIAKKLKKPPKIKKKALSRAAEYYRNYYRNKRANKQKVKTSEKD